MTMFLYPSAVSTEKEIIIPRGSYLSVGSIGDQPTLVQIGLQTPTGVVELLNRAQTFGPYANDRVATIFVRGATVEYDVGTQPKLRSFPALALGSLSVVSIVQPAATFITLTYDDDAGDVKLVSAGVHGLTNTVSQGTDLYITWTGGMAETGFYELLDADTATDEVTIGLPYIDATVTITIAAPGVVTWASHGLSVNDTIRFTTTGALPTGLAINTTYYVKQVLSPNTFTVSAAAGGAAITTSGTQSGTQTALVWYGVPVVAVANTAITLASVTVPGWSMGVGGGMEVDALFSMTNSAAAKNLGMSYGGSAILTVSAANNASACVQKLMCNRGNSQIITNSVNMVGHGLSVVDNTLIAVDATVDQTFAITAQPATANNVVKLEAFKLHINF
jgi:hypothetical protein